MSRDTATPKYDIKFNERDLAGYGPGDFPRFSVYLYLNKSGVEVEEDIAYFPATDKDMLIDYIKYDLQEELEEWSNIYRITINFEWDYDNIEEISIIYEKKNN